MGEFGGGGTVGDERVGAVFDGEAVHALGDDLAARSWGGVDKYDRSAGIEKVDRGRQPGHTGTDDGDPHLAAPAGWRAGDVASPAKDAAAAPSAGYRGGMCGQNGSSASGSAKAE